MPKFFPMNRYAKISQYLHLNDKRKELPSGHADHNKLFKVCALFLTWLWVHLELTEPLSG